MTEHAPLPAAPLASGKRVIEPLSHALARFSAQLQGDKTPITLRDIVAFFADRGIGALLFIFAAPMCIPLPMLPGMSIVFSLPIFVLAGLQIGGITRPLLPEQLASKTLNREFVAKAMLASIPWLEKVEKVAQPRLPFMMSDLAYRWGGIVIGLMAASIMFPLPFSNFGPGIAIVVMAVGRIMHDGLMILIGAVGGLLYCFLLYYTSYHVVVTSFETVLQWIGLQF